MDDSEIKSANTELDSKLDQNVENTEKTSSVTFSAQSTEQTAGDDTISNKTGTDRTGTDNASSEKTGSEKTGTEKTDADKTGSDKTLSNKTLTDKTVNDKINSSSSGSDKTLSDKTFSDSSIDITKNTTNIYGNSSNILESSGILSTNNSIDTTNFLSSSSTFTDSDIEKSRNVTKELILKKQFLHDIQKLKIELSQKNLLIDTLKADHLNVVDDLEEKLSDVMHKKQLIQAKFETQLRILQNEHNKEVKRLKLDLQESLALQKEYQMKFEDVSSKKGDMKTAFVQMDLKEEEYLALKGKSFESLSAAEHFNVKLYDNVHPLRVQVESLEQRINLLTSDLRDREDELIEQKKLYEDESHKRTELDIRCQRFQVQVEDLRSQLSRDTFRNQNYDNVQGHSKFLRPYCMRCGAQESIKPHRDIQRKYERMDNYLKLSNKIRKSFEGDGHCLPHAIFQGAKNLNLIPQFETYVTLLNSVVETIKAETETYYSFLTESVDSVFMDLDRYLKDKKYSLNSNIIDLLIFASARKTSCQIKVHYLDIDDSFDTHIISPSINKGVIELSLINGHYDLISKLTDVIKQEPCSVVEDPILEVENAPVNEKVPTARRTKKRVSSEQHVYDSKDDFVIESNTSGRPHKVSRPNEEFNDDTSVSTAIKVDSVPGDINDTTVYEVPMLTTLRNCKGNRPWGNAISSKSVKFKEGPRLLFHCRGSYRCTMPACRNIPEFSINRRDFHATNPVRCKICSSKAKFIPCHARLTLEKNNRAEIVTVKHNGKHSCPSMVVTGRRDSACVEGKSKNRINEVNSSSDEGCSEEEMGSIHDNNSDKRAMQLPKITQTKMRSLESKAFKYALDKSKEKSIHTKCTNILKMEDSAEVSIEQCKRIFKLTFKNSEVFCSCGPSKRADRKICSHLVWIYVNLLNIKEDDPLCAQVSLSAENLATILNCCPDSIPPHLNTCSETETLFFNERLKDHPNSSMMDMPASMVIKR